MLISKERGPVSGGGGGGGGWCTLVVGAEVDGQWTRFWTSWCHFSALTANISPHTTSSKSSTPFSNNNRRNTHEERLLLDSLRLFTKSNYGIAAVQYHDLVQLSSSGLVFIPVYRRVALLRFKRTGLNIQ